MPDRTTVPRARSAVLPPLQRSEKAAVATRSNAAKTAVGQYGGRSRDHKFHLDHRSGHLRQNYHWTQIEKKPNQEDHFKYKRNTANLTLIGVVYHYLITKNDNQDSGRTNFEDTDIMMIVIYPA